MKPILCVFAACVLILASTSGLTPASAAAPPNPTTKTGAKDDEEAAKNSRKVTFDHQSGDTSKHYYRTLNQGETLNVFIENTAKECFEYALQKVEAEKYVGPQGSGDVDLAGYSMDPIVHDAKYGGYVIDIRRLADRRGENDPCMKGRAKDLKEAILVISVDTAGIQVAFAGGFTVSELTNPVFGTRADPNGQDLIVRDRDAEDDYDLGVAAFIHVYGKSWSPWWPSLTLGLGIGDDSDTTFYVGPFWRLGDQAYVGGGVAFGSVESLPAGVRAGDPATQNVLNNLGSRTKSAAFFGLTYSFLGNRAAFEKPFQNVDKSGDQGSATTTKDKKTDNRVTQQELVKKAQEALDKFFPDTALASGAKWGIAVLDHDGNIRANAVRLDGDPQPISSDQQNELLEKVKELVSASQQFPIDVHPKTMKQCIDFAQTEVDAFFSKAELPNAPNVKLAVKLLNKQGVLTAEAKRSDSKQLASTEKQWVVERINEQVSIDKNADNCPLELESGNLTDAARP